MTPQLSSLDVTDVGLINFEPLGDFGLFNSAIQKPAYFVNIVFAQFGLGMRFSAIDPDPQDMDAVKYILRFRYPLQIRNSVVGLVAIFMVGLMLWGRGRSNKSQENESMNLFIKIFSIFKKGYLFVTSLQIGFNNLSSLILGYWSIFDSLYSPKVAHCIGLKFWYRFPSLHLISCNMVSLDHIVSYGLERKEVCFGIFDSNN